MKDKGWKSTDLTAAFRERVREREKTRGIIQRLLADGGTNAYTIEKNGVRKMIYQTAWRVDGIAGGLAEISMDALAEYVPPRPSPVPATAARYAESDRLRGKSGWPPPGPPCQSTARRPRSRSARAGPCGVNRYRRWQTPVSTRPA